MNGTLDGPILSQSPALSEILLTHLRAIDAHYWPGIDGMTDDVVLRLYYPAALAGQVPGKDVLLRQYPDLAAELDTFFAVTPLPAAKVPDDSSSPAVTGGIRAD